MKLKPPAKNSKRRKRNTLAASYAPLRSIMERYIYLLWWSISYKYIIHFH